MQRRNVLKAAVAATSILSWPSLVQSANALSTSKALTWDGIDLSWSPEFPPLFITAYIDPTIQSQKGQEKIIARYPIALVPSDKRIKHAMWRDKIKNINPDIRLFGYQMTIEETTVPSPGHDVMRKVKNCWVKYLGQEIRVKVGRQYFRIFDPRYTQWQEAFIEACMVTMDSYPYYGLLLDQCSVFDIAAPLPSIRQEMQQALQETLVRLRKMNPQLPMIANTGMQFPDITGDLMENRLDDLKKSSSSQRMDLYQQLMNDVEDSAPICKIAFLKKRLFGIAMNYQKAEWPRYFDQIASQYKGQI